MCQSNNKEILHNEVYVNIQTGEVLDWNRVEGLKDNALLKVRSDLWVEWDFKKNDELGLDIWKVTKGSDRKVWWLCLKCGSGYDMNVANRVGKSQKCPYCRGLRINHTNSLASLNPQLAFEWHPTKNEKTPYEITCGNSSKKVWWQCGLGHEWEATVDTRNKGNGCPYCGNRKLLVGFNDMWTTNPELAKLLVDPEDGYKYMQFSSEYVNWKCHSCDTVIENKIIRNINGQGLSCPRCSDGVSYPEKFVFNLLKAIDINFEIQKSFNWSNSKIYDFYIVYHNEILVETHGIQHYQESNRGRSIEEEQENDRYKYEMAMRNGIKSENYIVIDCSNSEMEWIRDNILNSRLAELFDLSDIDWNEIHINSQKSMNIEILELWKQGNSVDEIVEIVKMHKLTVAKKLKKFNDMGLCEYNKKIARKAYVNKVYQLSSNYEIIKVWEGAYEIVETLGVNQRRIYDAVNGAQNSYKGFIWKYEKSVIGWTVPIHNIE